MSTHYRWYGPNNTQQPLSTSKGTAKQAQIATRLMHESCQQQQQQQQQPFWRLLYVVIFP